MSGALFQISRAAGFGIREPIYGSNKAIAPLVLMGAVLLGCFGTPAQAGTGSIFVCQEHSAAHPENHRDGKEFMDLKALRERKSRLAPTSTLSCQAWDGSKAAVSVFQSQPQPASTSQEPKGDSGGADFPPAVAPTNSGDGKMGPVVPPGLPSKIAFKGVDIVIP